MHVVVNFDAKVDNKDDNELLQEWHQRLRQPRIDKDEASKQPCQDICSRAVAPPAGSGEAVPSALFASPLPVGGATARELMS